MGACKWTYGKNGRTARGGAGDENPRGNTRPEFDKDLIRRANGAGTFVDYGDAGVREFNRLADEIDTMDLDTEEKKEYINHLHNLMTAQLEAESKAISPYSAGVGPARFNRTQMDRANNKAAKARQDVQQYMDGLRAEQRRKKARREDDELINAARNALKSGALEFTVNGTTWRRKTRRSQKFTAD